ncbi:MAG: type II secretion system protein [Planctomycetota bacterium]
MYQLQQQTLKSTDDRRGFTIVELLVVIGVLAVLVGILIPAFIGVRSGAVRTKSANNLRQINVYLTQYADEYRDAVVPSQFNYSMNTVKGNVRNVTGLTDSLGQSAGTWADILWTNYELGVYEVATATIGHNYRQVAPDQALYDLFDDDQDQVDNVLRSFADNTRGVPGGSGALPYGTGAQTIGQPGYFAANNFFNADAMSMTFNDTFTNSQIRQPERSMYLVDSYAGATIEDDPEQWDNSSQSGSGEVISISDDSPVEVDFRYNGVALMLFMDGHTDTLAPWRDLDQLEQTQPIRVRCLDRRPGDCPDPMP